MPDPIVSIIVANFNGERFLADALTTARSQTLRAIEIIVVDDASSDRSVEIARRIASEDERIRVIARSTRSGPGAARNDGLAVARGEWIAILDSDDMMHPSRLEDLVRAAANAGADICADDLLVFGEGLTPQRHLSRRQQRLDWITTADFVDRIHSHEPPLGYLKPVIRTAFLRSHGLRYEPNLQIGEDYDLIMRLLAKGARFRLLNTIGYFYRKHASSISHRLANDNLERMLEADERLLPLFAKGAHDVERAFASRRASIMRALAFSNIVSAIKARKWGEAAMLALRKPGAIPLLAMPVAARLQRLWQGRASPSANRDENRICLISRQRLVGNTNGSSAYLISVVAALRDAGNRITLISPSTATFGRLPFLVLKPEMDVFDKVHIRGAWRIGNRLYVAKDPRIILAAASAIIARIGARIGLDLSAWDRPAPYAVAAPWLADDQLYIARHAPRSSRIILADYAFTTPAIPFALCPSARSAVVMHDFFSARAGRFRDQQLSDSVVALEEADEIQLLAQANAIIAIQQAEAEAIRRLLPNHRVLLVPHACTPEAAPQPGDRSTVLFVGSSAAPNVIGLQWFLGEVWPEIRRRVQDCQLLVAGSVATKFPAKIEGVEFLGVVPDLGPLYMRAGVVISPLTIGSGLKIKLIEALAQGKAIVATSTSTEGCDSAVVEAIMQLDDAGGFAEAVVALLADDALRQTKAAQALDAARRFYSSEASYSELLAYVQSQSRHDSALDKQRVA